jgi:protein-L-isoaspartate(D-aspartate) O-methyltransferase
MILCILPPFRLCQKIWIALMLLPHRTKKNGEPFQKMPAFPAPDQLLLEEKRVAFLLHLRTQGIRNRAVLAAMDVVPREQVIPARYVQGKSADFAYRDVPLPLSCGQIMLPPTILAWLLSHLEIEPHHRVLEVGTGSGYLTLLLATMAHSVVSCERYRTLARIAAQRITALKTQLLPLKGAERIQVLHADGLCFSSPAPQFDRIVLTGCVTHPPTSLLDQLLPGGFCIAVIKEAGEHYLKRFSSRSTQNFTVDVLGKLTLPPLEHGLSLRL